MVQESGSKYHLNVNTAVSRKDTGNLTDSAGRSMSQMGVKHSDSSKSYSSSSQKTDAQKYGAWGSVYKNKDHFTNMHLF